MDWTEGISWRAEVMRRMAAGIAHALHRGRWTRAELLIYDSDAPSADPARSYAIMPDLAALYPREGLFGLEGAVRILFPDTRKVVLGIMVRNRRSVTTIHVSDG